MTEISALNREGLVLSNERVQASAGFVGGVVADTTIVRAFAPVIALHTAIRTAAGPLCNTDPGRVETLTCFIPLPGGSKSESSASLIGYSAPLTRRRCLNEHPSQRRSTTLVCWTAQTHHLPSRSISVHVPELQRTSPSPTVVS